MADDFDWGSLSDSDWGDAVAGGVPNIDWGSLGIDPSTLATWGMGDRGLGTTQVDQGGGTLTGGQISNLAGDAQASGNYNPTAFQTGSSNPLDSIAKALGLTNKDGSANLLGLAGILGPLLGGIMAKNATSKASDQMQNAAKDANTMVQGMYQPAQAAFQPFINAGQGAIAKASGMNYQPLAPQFQPLGAGRAMTLGALGKGR